MIKVGVVGGTGYTGVELLRMLAQHSDVEVVAITSRAVAGVKMGDYFPSLRGRCDPASSDPARYEKRYGSEPAVHYMNLIFGVPETRGFEQLAMFP